MKIAGTVLQGDFHSKEGIPCQDYIKFGIYNNILIAALSDGAGSKKYGGETAEIAVSTVLRFFKRKKTLDMKPSEIPEKFMEFFEKEMNNTGFPEKDAGATLLFVIVKDNEYIAGHIGDGVIIMKDANEIFVLSEPENGQYSNETYFLSSDSAIDHFRMYSGKIDADSGFILASDGISEALYDVSEKKVAYSACEKLIDWIGESSKKEGDLILENNLKTVFNGYSEDDKSIIVVAK